MEEATERPDDTRRIMRGGDLQDGGEDTVRVESRSGQKESFGLLKQQARGSGVWAMQSGI